MSNIQEKKCKQCQSLISANAKRCPQCQADLRSWPRRHLILTTIFALFTIGIISAAFGTDTPTSPSGNDNASITAASTKTVEAIKITALQLSSDYKDNEVAADAKYKDKSIEVSGIVDAIGKDLLETPYIALQSYQYAIVDRVQCMFSKSDEPQLATISKGQQIILQGEVSGKLGNIIVRGCKIVK